MGAASVPNDPDAEQIVHASCIAVNGQGVLIMGPSGAGKSSLALQIMALGGELVADDRVILRRLGGDVIAQCPLPLLGLIEARGLGILRVPSVPFAPVRLIVDLSHPETERLPPRRTRPMMDVSIDLVFAGQGSHFSASILHYIKGGRVE